MKPDPDLSPSHVVAVESDSKNQAARPGEDPDRPLVGRARQGDTHAFRELVDRHRDRAYGLALRVLRSPSDAEEAAQDAFVKAWRALPAFRCEARFGTWLYAIVMRCSLDRSEILKRRRGREVELDAAADRATEPGGPPGDRAHEALRMNRLLGCLSAVQRAVVGLFYYEEFSVDEVATLLNLPTGTVKTHLSRARAVLREAVLREQRGEEHA